MSLLDKALKNGLGRTVNNAVNRAVNNAVGSAVEQGVRSVVQPAANKAANAVSNAAAQRINADANRATAALGEVNASVTEANAAASQVTGEQWNQAFSFLEGMANSAAKSMKICPSCGATAKADQSFCPSCGAKLPDMTVAEGALCPNCGKQNDIGTKFCTGCGSKLPAAVAEENATRQRDEAELAKWSGLLPEFPVWNCGGSNFDLQDMRGDGTLIAIFTATHPTGRAALRQYCDLLKQNGFTDPYNGVSDELLIKVINGQCYCFCQAEAFSGGNDCFSVSFAQDNSYLPKKQEPKKPGGLLGSLFG